MNMMKEREKYNKEEKYCINYINGILTMLFTYIKILNKIKDNSKICLLMLDT